MKEPTGYYTINISITEGYLNTILIDCEKYGLYRRVKIQSNILLVG